MVAIFLWNWRPCGGVWDGCSERAHIFDKPHAQQDIFPSHRDNTQQWSKYGVCCPARCGSNGGWYQYGVTPHGPLIDNFLLSCQLLSPFKFWASQAPAANALSPLLKEVPNEHQPLLLDCQICCVYIPPAKSIWHVGPTRFRLLFTLLIISSRQDVWHIENCRACG